MIWINNEPLPKRGELWFYTTEKEAEGSEQKGGRPCVIISNNKGNDNGPIITILPITSKDKKYLPTHHYIDEDPVHGTVLCEQITTISKQRLEKCVGQLSASDLEKIVNCITIQLALDPMQSFNSTTDEEKIKVRAERDLYKQLYENLLFQLTSK